MPKKDRVLLVIDVQRVYMEPEPMVTSDGDDLVPKCRSLIERARDAGVPVVYVQHVSDDQPDEPDLVSIHPEIAPQDREPILQKHFGSAFFRTSLEEKLNRLGAKTLYICGLATFGCVNATVMCALCKNYDVHVIRNAHGCSSFPGEPAGDTIAVFNSSWERAGAALVSFADVTF